MNKELPAGDASQKLYQYELGSTFYEYNHFPLSAEDQKTVDDFHKLYFRLNEKKPGLQLSWLGHQTGKVPSDIWVYQEMMAEMKPDLIIECGTHWGGSALYLANMCQLIGTGRVMTIDLYPKPNRPHHTLIEYITGSSVDPATIELVKSKAKDYKNILVILDSDHKQEHVYKEIKAYHSLVPVGGYLIVEDSFLGGHPSHKEHGPGPTEAIDQFLKENDSFVIDRSKERLLFTLNYRGFLKRIK
jgi:cephalosporin hydroxylase